MILYVGTILIYYTAVTISRMRCPLSQKRLLISRRVRTGGRHLNRVPFHCTPRNLWQPKIKLSRKDSVKIDKDFQFFKISRRRVRYLKFTGSCQAIRPQK